MGHIYVFCNDISLAMDLGDPINVGLRQVIAWTSGGTLFGLLCYAISKSKIKKVV